MNLTGWWDHCNGAMLLDRAIRAQGGSEVARQGSRTIIGPWSRSGLGTRHFGSIDFGPEAVMDLTAEQIRWFDYWLKGKSNGVAESASYRVFIMGENRWRDEASWPLKRAQGRVLYLTSGGQANTPAGDGRLVDKKPAESGADRYTYDPTDPVRSLHGPRLFQIPTDQRPLAHRPDILVYQTEPLMERVEVTGYPQAGVRYQALSRTGVISLHNREAESLFGWAGYGLLDARSELEDKVLATRKPT